MFEEEAKELIEITLHRVAEGRSSIALQDILAADVPSPLKTYFRTDAELLLSTEQKNYHTSSRFDHAHPEVQSLQRQINSILVLRYSYPETEFYDHLNDGVNLLIRYLAQPQRTIVESVFENKDEVAVEDIGAFLLRMEPYDYLRDLLFRYCKAKNIITINRGTFSGLLRKLDGAYISRRDGHQVSRILAPYFNMINFLRVRGEPALPLKACREFFEDKGLFQVSSALEGTAVQGKESLTAGELAVFLEVCWQTVGPLTIETTAAEPAPVPPSPRKTEIPPPPPPPPLSVSIPKMEIDEADRKRFIKKIFSQDEEAFNQIIEKLRQLSRWKDASRAIDELLITRGIDPYSSDARHFLKVLYQQYYPNSQIQPG